MRRSQIFTPSVTALVRKILCEPGACVLNMEPWEIQAENKNDKSANALLKEAVNQASLVDQVWKCFIPAHPVTVIIPGSIVTHGPQS